MLKRLTIKLTGAFKKKLIFRTPDRVIQARLMQGT